MAKPDNRKLEVIEVFPTTPQLIAGLIIALVILCALLFLNFRGTEGSVEIAEEKPAKMKYFNTITLAELAMYEGNIAGREALKPSGVRPLDSEVIRTKLERALELTLSSKLADIYAGLDPEEQVFVRTAVSDWKLSRLLTRLEAADSQELVTDILADYAQAKEDEENAPASAAKPTSVSSDAEVSGADVGNGVVAGGGDAAGASDDAVSAGDIQGMFEPTDNLGE
ncbi:hypothetical protein J7K50_04230 [bacterium]|nr:hypothetical protein [bacterium]